MDTLNFISNFCGYFGFLCILIYLFISIKMKKNEFNDFAMKFYMFLGVLFLMISYIPDNSYGRMVFTFLLGIALYWVEFKMFKSSFWNIPKPNKNLITVVKRIDDYMAYLNGDKGFWDCGKTKTDAIANLVRTWGKDKMNIIIEDSPNTNEY